MPSTKEIRRRIRTTQKTRQITSAMRMVSAAKLRRAQDAILAARPYAQRMYGVLGEIRRRHWGPEHPLLAPREKREVHELVVITSDRGLCGAFNANVLKKAQEIARELQAPGLAGGDLAGRPQGERLLPAPPPVHRAARVGESRDDRAPPRRGDLRARRQALRDRRDRRRQRRLRGVRLRADADAARGRAPPAHARRGHRRGGCDAAALPDRARPRDACSPRSCPRRSSSPSTARCSRTRPASTPRAWRRWRTRPRNTDELIGSLTLQFNRARQAAITKELMEIVSGAEALK